MLLLVSNYLSCDDLVNFSRSDSKTHYFLLCDAGALLCLKKRIVFELDLPLPIEAVKAKDVDELKALYFKISSNLSRDAAIF